MAERKEAPELVGLAEAAPLLGVSKAALWERRRGRSRIAQLLPFPQPIAELKCGPIWLRSQIEDYAQKSAELEHSLREERELGIDPALDSVLWALPVPPSPEKRSK